MRKPANIIAAFGLVLGGVLGMVGTMVAQQNVRAIAWGIDGTALVVATCLLALRYFRKGNDCVAAGFLVYPIGEGGHGAVGGRASAYGDSERVCAVDAHDQHCGWSSVCDCGWENILRPAGAADYLATAVLRLSVPGAHVCRLVRELAEGGLTARRLHAV
jgi:hypothetical protein